MAAGRCAGLGRIIAILSEAARLFSTGLENVPELITKQAQELRDAGKSVQKLVEDLAEIEAAQLVAASPGERRRARRPVRV